MRDKGGTLCSPAIDRKKSSSSFPGAKANGHNNAMPTGASVGRLKGGSTVLLNGSNRDHGHNSELLDHHPSIVTKKSKDPVEGEALKRKVPISQDDGALPQWGQGKRSRCSRNEPKHAVSSPSGPDEPTNKTATRIEKQQATPSLPPPPPPPPPPVHSNAKMKGQGAVRLGAAASINSKKEEITIGRNGLANTNANGFVRASVNGCSHGDARVRQITASNRGRTGEQERECGRASPQKKAADPPVSTTTSHRNPVLNNNGSSSNHKNHTTNTTAALLDVSEADPTTATTPVGHTDDNKKHPLTSLGGRVDIDTLEWPRILISLSRKEKEEDFLAIKNSKLSQRPKKRPKVVEKALQFITPGNWLSDLTRGRYDVREKKCTKKKPGGLKAMESLESDSE